MFNFKEGVKVTTAYGHEPMFAGVAGGGELPKTLTVDPTSKIKDMTLFPEFLVATTKTNLKIALPISNFKTFILAQES